MISSDTPPKGPALGIRHLQALLLFICIIVNYIARLNVSVIVVAMTDAASTNPDFPEYDWTEAQKSYILSSFYWGYIFTQFPAGLLCKRYGVKTILFIPTFATALFSAITPYSITSGGGWQAFCVLRVIQGVFQGLIFPCIHEHIAKWSPPAERNRLGVFTYSGADCGMVLANAITGLIAHSSLGWPGISYVSAALCAFWCLLWFLLGSNNAPESRLISAKEQTYIESSMQRADGFHERKIPIPWRAIWTSKPFLALLLVRCADGWSSSTMQQQTPSYLHGVLNMDIKSNALYSALPYLAMWFTSYVYLAFADLVMARQWMSRNTLHKSINSLSLWGPAVALIGIGFLDKSQESLAIALMTISAALNAGAGLGSILPIIDMSPNHSGILMAISNGIANLFPLITPLVVGLIVTDTSDRSLWQIVFTTAAIIFFLGNLVYIIWGSTDKQDWDAADFLQFPHDECLKNEKKGKKSSSNNDDVISYH
ncbi:putative inorganic phosphate cotransporter [Scaptodrosophila lebanonensis]|uniref:Putative inorganic phosphate cotransporter n=1 Tax=Drosophila lebanonensis TaxID=7225 RepID=A0A6J2U2W9_DROLE|nr:putative inorganic phosphate cotransporter [Scaptodrosophila lebanonensis]